MKKYEIKIIEQLSRVVEQTANCHEKAIDKVINKYNDGEIVLNYEDLEEVNFDYYPSPKLKENFNISIKYDSLTKLLKIAEDDCLKKEYEDCTNYDDFMFYFKDFLENYRTMTESLEETKNNDGKER